MEYLNYLIDYIKYNEDGSPIEAHISMNKVRQGPKRSLLVVYNGHYAYFNSFDADHIVNTVKMVNVMIKGINDGILPKHNTIKVENDELILIDRNECVGNIYKHPMSDERAKNRETSPYNIVNILSDNDNDLVLYNDHGIVPLNIKNTRNNHEMVTRILKAVLSNYYDMSNSIDIHGV